MATLLQEGLEVMLIRRPEPSDKRVMTAMMKEFYNTDAVLHPVPESNFDKTFDLLFMGRHYADAFLAEENGMAAGYALLSLTWSNEAGGLTVWLEEIYVRPEYRGMGIGKSLITRVFREYKDKAVRFRLETEPLNNAARRLYKSLGFQEFPYYQMALDMSANRI
ncbi:GNAT family N-acetyltransferase [Thermocaproicibacter melissae]|jgi:diamine N-acetyltransferase|uniref:GNAT family N-acetyltransferase n=1 Tax=Thermocaproicibacter melissae TaxID=2966552 RepID=UPI0024B08015|nr:GNAT family N-acetyltransferase [Thermocaproicibacter melissae]WBY64355.1 GNAT family N-acetyltransferase [Thermocaproicibacter melissae]